MISTGKQCTVPDCKQLDFLPLQCSCNKFFCQQHYFEHGVSCEQLKQNFDVCSSTNSTVFKCSSEDCKEVSLLALKCLKCDKHYCIKHRYHTKCYDLKTSTPTPKISEQEIQKVYGLVDQKVTEQLAKALKKPNSKKTANKIILMRLRGRATGETNIPTTDRVYFTVYFLKKDETVGSLPVYVSSTWSIGRCIDSVAKLCSLANNNNQVNGMKLRFFVKETQEILVAALSERLQVLIANATIFDGQDLVLDYTQECEPLNKILFV